MFGVGSYKGQLYPHYFGFLFPLPFILIGITLAMFLYSRKARMVGIIATAALLFINLTNQKIWGKGSNLIDQTKNVAEEVAELAQREPFNFALITNGNSDHAYRYFLEIAGHRPTMLEEQVTGQLIVVCENPNLACKPLGHPLWEIAGFGRAEIFQETSAYPYIKIVKLIHHEESMPFLGKPAPKGE